MDELSSCHKLTNKNIYASTKKAVLLSFDGTNGEEKQLLKQIVAFNS